MKARAGVALHRFRDLAAIETVGTAGTVYLDARAARELARAAARLARDLERESFSGSSFAPITIQNEDLDP